MPRLRKFVHDKSKTLLGIASHILTNIEYNHMVPSAIFEEIILLELTPELESKHRDFDDFFLFIQEFRAYSNLRRMFILLIINGTSKINTVGGISKGSDLKTSSESQKQVEIRQKISE